MITDDLRTLAVRAEGVEGRGATRLAEVHGRIRSTRRRRAAAAGAGVAGLALAALVLGTTLRGSTQHTEQPIDVPSPEPTPTLTERPQQLFHPAKGTKRLTPRQAVLSDTAGMNFAIASPDDPAVRLSSWTSVCEVCRRAPDARLAPTFSALAVTGDGFRTASYVRLPILILDAVRSVDEDNFLLVDEANGVQRLVSTDGSVRRVHLVAEERTPDDPRLVVPCGGFEVGYGDGWCVLDVASATEARVRDTLMSSGTSDGDPALGQRPWGLESVASGEGRTWWDDGGVRKYQWAPLVDGSDFDAVPSLARGEDTPTYVRWRFWSHALDVFTVKDRAAGLEPVGSRSWVPLERRDVAEVGHPKEVGAMPHYARTADGALLAWATLDLTDDPGFTVWRAPSLMRGDFETVYEGPPKGPSAYNYEPELLLRHGRLHLGTLVSDDDGRTWTEPITTWR